MRKTSLFLLVPAALAIGLGACRADREAGNPREDIQVDMRPDPRIQQAPAMPTPPVGVPIGLEPDTTRGDTVRLDTIGQPQPGAPGTAPPRRP